MESLLFFITLSLIMINEGIQTSPNDRIRFNFIGLSNNKEEFSKMFEKRNEHQKKKEFNNNNNTNKKKKPKICLTVLCDNWMDCLSNDCNKGCDTEKSHCFNNNEETPLFLRPPEEFLKNHQAHAHAHSSKGKEPLIEHDHPTHKFTQIQTK